MRILLVEDDARIAEGVAGVLEGEGFAVDRVGDGETALARGMATDYAAVVLDLGLPRLDGLAVLKRWRAKGRDMPVLVLSARADWVDRVEGIDAGADDYLPKPFRMEEALARLKAIIRRTAVPAVMPAAGSLVHDERRMLILLDEQPMTLTPLEYRLLAHLITHSRRVVPQAELLSLLYGEAPERDVNAVEVLIGRVRRKVGADLIQTRRGHGYVLDPDAK